MLHSKMDERRTDSCREIVYQELLRTPDPLQHTSEDIECIHVEEKVEESAVHEHVCHQLPWVTHDLERIKGKKPEHQWLVEIGHDHHQDIDDDEVLDRSRNSAHEAASVVIVIHFIRISFRSRRSE